jgi:pimeloyl-ACP methyl ester carboxylesterase
VYLSGGPGSGALDELVAGAWRIFLPILEKRKLVVIDQRGTGYSVPKLSCTEFSSTSDALTSVDLTKLQACHDRLTGLGVDLSQYNTATNAADIRSLRTALGYASWNLLGISYGTRLAQEIMRQSTEGLRSVVLDSTLPPDVDLLAKSAADMARSLQQVFDTCDAKPYCDRTTPNFLERLDAVVDKLNASPLSVNVSGAMFTFSGDTLLGLVHALLYSPSTIPFVPMLVWELDQNDTSFVDALYRGVTAQPSTIADAMHLSVACSEWVPRTSQAAFEEASAGVDPRVASALDPKNTYIKECPLWGVTAAPVEEAAPVNADTPTLVLSGNYDPITPPEWGQHVASGLAHAQFVLFQGGAHALTTLDCGGKFVASFIDAAGPVAEPSCPEHDSPISFAGLPGGPTSQPLSRREKAARDSDIDIARNAPAFTRRMRNWVH